MSSETFKTNTSSTLTGTLSKRLGSLQDFQSRITQRIAQAQSQSQKIDPLLSIQVQSLRLLIPLSQVNELLSMPVLTTLPLAKRVVLGLTVVRSEVLTVFDLAYCLRVLLEKGSLGPERNLQDFTVAKSAMTERQVDSKLIVLGKTVANQLAFPADKVLGTLQADSAGLTLVYPTPDGHQAENGSFIKAIWRNADGEMSLELSLGALFKSSDFTQLAY